MNQIKIDKNAPPPDQSRGNRNKYPWREMEIGDSFFAPGKLSVVSSAANSARIRLGHRYTCRRATEGGVEGIRVWRIK